MKIAPLACWIFLAALFATGCTNRTASVPANVTAPTSTEVLLFGAASTGDALDEIRAEYRERTGVEAVASYAATSALAQQVLSGASADVFVSANTRWADDLARHGHVAARQDLLGNRLVLIVPADSMVHVGQPGDLLESSIKHIAVADPDAVPAGLYAKSGLAKLGLWDNLAGKLVNAADVRQALTMVETGAAEAGFVYSTDAADSASVKIACTIDEELTGPIVYPVLLLKSAQGNREAEAFFQFLFSPPAREIFRNHGFEVRLAP
jgi:molybdate transport system substrate-binding protein